MSWAAGQYGLDVERPEVADVFGDDGAPLSSRERQHVRIGESLPFGVPGHGLDVVTSGAQFAGDDRGEHLVEEQPHCLTAACPADQAALASAASCSLASIHRSISSW